MNDKPASNSQGEKPMTKRALKYRARNGGSSAPRTPKTKEQIEAGLEKARSMGGIVTYRIPTANLGYVIGKGGVHLKAIRKATNVKIDIDEIKATKSNESFYSTEIYGSPYQVRLAISMLDFCVNKAIEGSKNYTHFLCIPIIHDVLERRFKQILEQIAEMDLPDMTKKYLIDHRRLHINFGKISLPREKQAQEAERLLLSLKPEISKIIGFLGLNMDLRGLGYYPNDPEKVRSLYVKVDYDTNENLGSKFKETINFIRKKFKDYGFSMDEEDQYTEHIVICQHRSPNFHGHDLSRDNQLKADFNAKPILEKFADVELGSYRIPMIQLCLIDTYKANARCASVADLMLD